MCSHESLTRIVMMMCRETGADGSAESRVRRLQGGNRAPRLPQPWYTHTRLALVILVQVFQRTKWNRDMAVAVKSEQAFSVSHDRFRHRDERVPAQERWVLARRGHQRDRLPGHVPGPGVRVPRRERRPLRGRRLH